MTAVATPATRSPRFSPAGQAALAMVGAGALLASGGAHATVITGSGSYQGDIMGSVTPVYTGSQTNFIAGKSASVYLQSSPMAYDQVWLQQLSAGSVVGAGLLTQGSHSILISDASGMSATSGAGYYGFAELMGSDANDPSAYRYGWVDVATPVYSANTALPGDLVHGTYSWGYEDVTGQSLTAGQTVSSVLAPASAVPEPSSLALLAAGLGAVGLKRRRARQSRAA